MPQESISRCRQAATRAYRELRRRGIAERHAFGAAVRVFGYHFPATSPLHAFNVVSDWVDDSIEPTLN